MPNQADLITEAKEWTETLTNCIDCGETIYEAYPISAEPYRKPRVRCCKCLEKFFRGRKPW